MRRILIIAAVIVVLVGVGVGAYFMFFAGAGDLVVAPQDGTGSLPEAGSASTTPEETQGPVDVGQPTKVAQRLVQISKGPVAAGVVAYQASSSAATTDIGVRFIARESGNMYEYLPAAGTLTRTSNKTIPGIQEVVWRPDGSLAYARYLSGDSHETINTYALPVSGEGGYFLAQNIVSLAANATNILALAGGANGSVATLSRPDGSQSKQVFMSPLASLTVRFLGSQYVAYTKPAGGLTGFAYLVNSTGNFERLAGPLAGLAALPSPAGKWVLLSYTASNVMQLALLNVGTRELTALPVATIADKCVWAKDESALYCGVPANPPTSRVYPDDWYQGAVSFNDRVWRVDVAGRFAELVLDFNKETDQVLDATSLATDPKGAVLVFRNKLDASLWLYEL